MMVLSTNQQHKGFYMSEIYQNKTFATREDQSAGGKARAAKLSPERRKEIAINASHSRKSYGDILRSTHAGELLIGDIKISCAVLEDGKRVITQRSMNSSLGRSGKRGSIISHEGALIMPNFLAANNLKPFIDEELEKLVNPVVFLQKKSGKAFGYDATILPKVCNVYLRAREMGALLPNQKQIADKCEILVRALAEVGIIALVDESSGYQQDREKDELQKLFTAFIAKELQPWVKRFPFEFFSNLKRMYGLEEMKRTPSFVGHLINKWIYKELSPEIHEELKRLNPTLENGRRKHSHHQLLTVDIGCPALEKQIQKVTTLLSVSDSKEEFEVMMEKSKQKLN